MIAARILRGNVNIVDNGLPPFGAALTPCSIHTVQPVQQYIIIIIIIIVYYSKGMTLVQIENTTKRPKQSMKKTLRGDANTAR